MALRALVPGTITTVQDLGRVGYERFGVPQSGAMDWFALLAANRLVGNPPGAAALEFTLEAPTLQADDDCLVAAAGCGYSLSVQGRRVGLWRAALVWHGEVIRLVPEGPPGWCCLAVLGGFDIPAVMGSRSTFLRGGLGGWHGRALRQEDLLPVGRDRPAGWKQFAGRWLPVEHRPAYALPVTIPVILGPQAEAFTDEAEQLFLTSEYTVSVTSDRMGYRLQGPTLVHRTSADLISEPLPWGAVQVPADGQPIVMMSDRPTSGGYPKIATAARAGLPLLAQAMPGSGRVRFQAVTVAEGQERYRALLHHLETGIEEGYDDEAY